MVTAGQGFGQVGHASWGDLQLGALSIPGASPGCGVSGPANSGHHGVDDSWGPQEPSSIFEARGRGGDQEDLCPRGWGLEKTWEWLWAAPLDRSPALSLLLHQHPLLWALEQSWAPTASTGGHDPDGRRDCRWHGLPRGQEVCAPRPSSPKLHGVPGPHCQDWGYRGYQVVVGATQRVEQLPLCEASEDAGLNHSPVSDGPPPSSSAAGVGWEGFEPSQPRILRDWGWRDWGRYPWGRSSCVALQAHTLSPSLSRLWDDSRRVRDRLLPQGREGAAARALDGP